MSDDPQRVEMIPILPSVDIGETQAFYRDQLGFAVTYETPAYLIVRRQEMELHFWLTDNRALCEATSVYACGITQLFVPQSASFLPPETTGGWQRLGAELGRLAESYRPHGISVGYHNKTAGFSLLSTARYGFEVMFEAARGSPLVWQADIAWLSRAGVNPAEWLQRYAKVLVSAHVKDRAPEGANPEEDGWADVGAGTLMWPSLWRLALANGAKTLVVEHDSPKRPFEFAQTSFAYLSRFMAHSG